MSVCIAFVFLLITCKQWSFPYLSDSIPPYFIFILFKQKAFTSLVSFYWIFLYWSFQSNSFLLPYYFHTYHVHFYIEVIIWIFHCHSSLYSISTTKYILKTWFQYYHQLLRRTILKPSDGFRQCILQFWIHSSLGSYPSILTLNIVHSSNYPTDFNESKNKLKVHSCTTLSHIHTQLHICFLVQVEQLSFLPIYEAWENC